MRLLVAGSCLVVAIAACGSKGPIEPDPDAPVGPGIDAATDAPVEVHSGGWRRLSFDATHSFHSQTAGPRGAATLATFHEETTNSIMAPVIDEAGNLYFMVSVPSAPDQFVSLTADGAERWRITLDASTFLDDVSLAANGDIYALARDNQFPPQALPRLVSFDPATGAQRNGTLILEGAFEAVVNQDGTAYLATFTEAAGYRLAKHKLGTNAELWSRLGGSEFAVAPSGDVVVIEEVVGPSSVPYKVVSLDPDTGIERWHHELVPELTSSATIAIDSDGSIYVAASGATLHVLKLSPNGDLVWERVTDSFVFPSALVLGSDSVSVACQAAQSFAGFTIQKVDGNANPAAVQPCFGRPSAVDSDGVIYWTCNGGVQAADSLGTIVGGWPGAFTFQVVLGPNGAAYEVPASVSADHTLFRIK